MSDHVILVDGWTVPPRDTSPPPPVPELALTFQGVRLHPVATLPYTVGREGFRQHQRNPRAADAERPGVSLAWWGSIAAVAKAAIDKATAEADARLAAEKERFREHPSWKLWAAAVERRRELEGRTQREIERGPEERPPLRRAKTLQRGRHVRRTGAWPEEAVIRGDAAVAAHQTRLALAREAEATLADNARYELRQILEPVRSELEAMYAGSASEQAARLSELVVPLLVPFLLAHTMAGRCSSDVVVAGAIRARARAALRTGTSHYRELLHRRSRSCRRSHRRYRPHGVLDLRWPEDARFGGKVGAKK